MDTDIRHVGNNMGHDLYLQHIRNNRRISVFPNNPIRKTIINAAESVSRKLGFMARESLEDHPVEIKMKEAENTNDDITNDLDEKHQDSNF